MEAYRIKIKKNLKHRHNTIRKILQIKGWELFTIGDKTFVTILDSVSRYQFNWFKRFVRLEKTDYTNEFIQMKITEYNKTYEYKENNKTLNRICENIK